MEVCLRVGCRDRQADRQVAGTAARRPANEAGTGC